jgi:hypothetical protein
VVAGAAQVVKVANVEDAGVVVWATLVFEGAGVEAQMWCR